MINIAYVYTFFAFFFFQELREIHNRQQLQKQKNLEAERLKQKEQERKTELEKQKEAQRQQSALVYTLSAEVLECKAFCKKVKQTQYFPERNLISSRVSLNGKITQDLELVFECICNVFT